MKKLVAVLLVCVITQLSSFAEISIEDLNSPKEHLYRLGTADNPEIKFDFSIEPIGKRQQLKIIKI